MVDKHIQLSKPPIVEAVLDIDCDFDGDVDLASLEARTREVYGDRYPNLEPHLEQQFAIKAEAQRSTFSSTQKLHAFRLLGQERKTVVQVRGRGYSFNRLQPYTSLDDYLGEIEETWRKFVDLTSPVQVIQMRLRFINRIQIPLVDGRAKLHEFFEVAPRLPGEGRLDFTGFLNQHAAKDRVTGHEVATVLTSEKPQDSVLPVIFDNSALATTRVRPEDWNSIRGTLLELRGLKNHVFRNTLTDKCLQLFL